MKFIAVDNENITNPKINLAIEEYALKNLPIDDSYLLFYVNEPSIIIGKNQNTLEEINKDYVDEHGIHVVRRLSGGGAVYHDLGNLNFSFITKDDGNSFQNFQKFTQPVVDTLNKMGVEAELSGRNDIHVGERKISGNAQYTTRGRMFSHGTLMLDSEIETVVKALNVSDEKIRSKGIKSIRSRVANINEFLEEKITVADLKKAILEFVFAEGDVETYELTDEDWEGIHEISESRYQNWDWNYGRNPKFDLQRSKRFDAGTIDIRLDVKKQVIQDVKIFGDFFGVGDVSEVEEMLKNVPYEKNAIHEALSDLDMSYYFGRISREDFIELIY
ncbi:lipoate--protein ligase [Salisediminibacterium halotolerans]|uniref:lipoate--protein ligase n=1 Tax=Salisediminibacterium halotolerans TaxID=517425 RepID=UPI000EB1793D|nr:lipoate--protein ligase [Salisediminibacterium halotolerans]RLJ78201.1 lipoate-protein ligase [Actinophytocola xinjiangensis]RPE88460.1 lipoate-protein ligase [Salisediminibacterium halotolerans]TWG37178.1 lipoate-protein ligase [Salisediminibacterium halotolerans]GEL09140.1 lipoate-protein ligase LplJ [Salisediminibacterium halotolerans]